MAATWLAAGLGVALGVGAAGTPAAAREPPQPGSNVVDLALRDGDVERIWYRQPERPVAVVVLFPGNDGVVRIDETGRFGALNGNFLVRMRDAWLARDLAVAIPDAPTGGWRKGAGDPAVARAVIAHIRTQTAAPIWLVGTSRGSVRAAYAAAGVQTEIAGLVLSSSVTRPSRLIGDTVFSTDLDRIVVPTLVVAHRGDRCVVSPPSDAGDIRKALSRAPRTEVVTFEGGSPPRADACEGGSEHGYFGIETEVVDRIAAWIKTP
jgi:hypothetical protein